MKTRKLFLTGLLTLSVLAAGAFVSDIPGAAAAESAAAEPAAAEPYKSGAVVPAGKAPAVREAAKEQSLSDYYITSGKKLDQAVATLQGLPPEKTGLVPGQDYTYRMDKTLTGDYFHHVRAYIPNNSVPAGDYLIAKDNSCIFRRNLGENRTDLLEGTTEKLMEKVEIYAIYRKIPMESDTKLFIRVPGNIPYSMALTSLNENIITVGEDESGQPVLRGIARGKADVLAEVTIGDFSKSKKVNFIIMDEKDMEREENRSSGWGLPIGIGIGIGGGHHHHRHGGVVIGI